MAVFVLVYNNSVWSVSPCFPGEESWSGGASSHHRSHREKQPRQLCLCSTSPIWNDASASGRPAGLSPLLYSLKSTFSFTDIWCFLVSSHRGRPRCRWRRCTTSPQRKTTNSASAPGTSSKCWTALMSHGGKGGCEGRVGCFLPTTRHSCEKTPRAMHLLHLHTWQTRSAGAAALNLWFSNINTEQTVTRLISAPHIHEDVGAQRAESVFSDIYSHVRCHSVRCWFRFYYLQNRDCLGNSELLQVAQRNVWSFILTRLTAGIYSHIPHRLVCWWIDCNPAVCAHGVSVERLSVNASV